MGTCVALGHGHQREKGGRGASRRRTVGLQVLDSAGIEIVRDARTERPLGVTEGRHVAEAGGQVVAFQVEGL